jgi:hypothetical protein
VPIHLDVNLSRLVFLGVALATLPGCTGQPSQEARAAAAPDTLHQITVSKPAVTRVFIMSSGGGIRPAPPEPEPERRPEPTATYVSLEAARDTIGAIVARCVSKADTAVHVSREAVTFEHRYLKEVTSRGWAFRILVTDTTTCPDTAIEKALEDAGWVWHAGYMADGPDGSTMGFLCKNYFCLVEGHWDGGDDSDSTYVPAPGCQVVVTCVPRREDDFPNW